MDTQKRLSFITEIARKDANVGKTGMMKLLYLLQTVYKVPLGYEFSIYTYGPYSQTVMSDIEYAEFSDYINISSITYSPDIAGYQINSTETGNKRLEMDKDFLDTYRNEIDQAISAFGRKSAKDLELYSTIVFVVATFMKEGLDASASSVCNTVKEIKPRFSNDVISAAYDDLDSKKLLQLSAV